MVERDYVDRLEEPAMHLRDEAAAIDEMPETDGAGPAVSGRDDVGRDDERGHVTPHNS